MAGEMNAGYEKEDLDGNDREQLATKFTKNTTSLESALLRGDRWFRLKRFIGVVAVMFCGLLLLNGLFVGYSFYSLLDMTGENIDVHMLSITGLCSDLMELRTKVAFKNVLGLDILNVSFERPIVLTLRLPDVSSSHVAKLTIPPFFFGYDRKYLDFTEHPIQIDVNEQFNFQSLLDAMISRSATKMELAVDASFRTSSFIIPVHINLNTVYSSVANFGQYSRKESGSAWQLKQMNFVNGVDSKGIVLNTLLSLHPKLLPEFLELHVPQLGVELLRQTLDRPEPVTLALLHVDAQTFSSRSSEIRTTLSLDARNKEPIAECIKQLIKKDYNMSLIIKAVGHQTSSCKIHRISSNISHQLHLKDLLGSEIPTRGKNDSLPFIQHTKQPSQLVARFLFTGQPALATRPNALTLSSDLDARYFLGLIGLDSAEIIGRFPSVSLNLVLEHGVAHSVRNSTISSVFIENLGRAHNLSFATHLTIIDGEKVVMAGVRAAHPERPLSQLPDELRTFRRLLLTPTPDGTLISHIMSLFELQFRFTTGLTSFTNGDLFTGGEEKGSRAGIITDFTCPERLDSPVAHAVNVDVQQSLTEGSASIHVKLHKAAVMVNPVVKIEWDSLQVKGISQQGVSLFTVEIEPGSLMTSLAPLRPTLLLHNGQANIRIRIEPPLEGIEHLMAQLKSNSAFIPLTLKGRLGDQQLELAMAVPPLSAVSNTAFQILEDNQANERRKKALNLRLIGMKSSQYQLLLDLGEAKGCDKPGNRFGSTIQINGALPELRTNICLFRSASNMGCLASASSKRIGFSVSVVDANVCGLRTILLPESQTPDEIDAFYRNNAKMRRRNHIQEIVYRHANSTSPSNYIPISVDVFDYKKAFEALDAMYEDPALDACTLAPGQHSAEKDSKKMGWNVLINTLSALFRYRLNYSIAGLSEKYSKSIALLPETLPIVTKVNVWSPSRHSMHGSISITVPEAAVKRSSTHADPIDPSAECDGYSFEWGPIEMALAASESDYLKLAVTEGRIFMAYDKTRSCPPSTTSFVVDFEIKTGHTALSSGDLRRAIHHLVEDRFGQAHPEMKLNERKLSMTAKVGQYKSPVEFQELQSELKLRTLVQLGHVCYAKYKFGKPSGVPVDWDAVIGLDALPRVNLNSTSLTELTRFPCFFGKPCGDLIYNVSPRSHLGKANVRVTRLIQRLFDIVTSTLGRMVNSLSLARYPTVAKMAVNLHAPLLMSATINDSIDIVEMVIPGLRVERAGDIDYPGGSAEHIIRKRSRRIIEDTFDVSAYLRLPEHYHDLTGMLQHIDFDPLMRVKITPTPFDDLEYSPSSLMLSNERLADSNLLSSLGCVLLEEIAMPPLPSKLAPREHGEPIVTAPTSNKHLVELLVQDIFIPNPTTNLSFLFERPVLAEYVFRGRVFGRARIEPAQLSPGLSPITVRSLLTKDCFGQCDTLSDRAQEDMGRFLAGAALGSPLEVTAVVHVAPGLSLSIPFKHPHRQVELAVFDAEATFQAFTEYGLLRTVNALDPIVNRGSRFMDWWHRQSTKKIWEWWSGYQDDHSRLEEAEEEKELESKGWGEWVSEWWKGLWMETANGGSATRGHSNYDLNIPISLRNEVDLEMRLFGLYLNIAFDDSDGFYFVPRDGDHSPIRNTMYMAQRECHPKLTQPFHKHSFLKCILEHPRGPASVLHARSSLAGHNVIMTPIPLSSRFVARVLDEAVNHDGPCLRITPDSFLTVGLSNGAGRDEHFTLSIPLDMSVDLELNPFGDACGKNTQCVCVDQLTHHDNLQYFDSVTGKVSQLHLNDTIHLNNGQAWIHNASLDLRSSWQVQFTLERTRPSMAPFSHSVPGFAFVLQQNGRNVTVVDGTYGYSMQSAKARDLPDQPLNRSVAVLFEPHTIDDRPLALRTISNIPYLGWKGAPPNAISILSNGSAAPLRVPNPKLSASEQGSAKMPPTDSRAELVLKRINGVFPPHETTINVRIVHNPSERSVVIYTHGPDNSSNYHTIFPLDLAKLLPETDSAWFGFTGKAEGRVQEWSVHGIQVTIIRPDLSASSVFWPAAQLAPKPYQAGVFYIQLNDECGRTMGWVKGLECRLELIDSIRPRSVIPGLHGQSLETETFGARHPKSSLLYNPPHFVVDAHTQYDRERRIYKVEFSSPRPGRFAVMLRTQSHEQWTLVRWHAILVRPYF